VIADHELCHHTDGVTTLKANPRLTNVAALRTNVMLDGEDIYSLWLVVDGLEACLGSRKNDDETLDGATWSMVARPGMDGTLSPLALTVPGSAVVPMEELAGWTKVNEVAAKSEAEFVNLDAAIRKGDDRQTLITESLTSAEEMVVANAADIIRVSGEVVQLSEDLAKVSNHTLAECTPDAIDNAKATPQGNVLAGTYVRFACSDGWFVTDAGSEDGLFCPLGGGEMVGDGPICTACHSLCGKCSSKTECIECKAKGDAVVKGYCKPELGTKQQPADSCKALLAAHSDLISDLYYIGDKSASHQAWCDMKSDGGGWEMLWKQGGGPDLPNSITSTNNMRAGIDDNMEYVMPPAVGKPRTHSSSMSSSYNAIAATKGLELLRVSTTWQKGGAKVR
jgi:hypothetical protein